MNTYRVYHLDQSDNETHMTISANHADTTESGDLVLTSGQGVLVAGFAKGRWHRFEIVTE